MKLFRRLHRSIALTDAGALLAHDVAEAFGRLQATVTHLGRLGATDHVTLSVSTAFANYWMVPRLQAFRERYPNLDLRLQTTDKELDLAHEGLSLGVRRDLEGQWEGYDSALLAPERLQVVAAPSWLAAHPEPLTMDTLAGAPLIHLEEPFRERPGWADWFAHYGIGYRDSGSGLRLNDYALVLQAAMAGEGVALGFQHVTEGLVSQGLLAPVGPWEFVTGRGFFLVWSNRQEIPGITRAVRDWMLEDAAPRPFERS